MKFTFSLALILSMETTRARELRDIPNRLRGLDNPANNNMEAIHDGFVQDISGRILQHTECPTGWNNAGSDSTGYTCTKAYEHACGIECASQSCEEQGGTWIPLDYASNPYTCKFHLFQCPADWNPAGWDHDSYTCIRSWSNTCGGDCAIHSCTEHGGTLLPLDYASNPFTCEFDPAECPTDWVLSGWNSTSYTCLSGWTHACGEECKKLSCTGEDGRWIPLDPASNPYTCQFDKNTDEDSCDVGGTFVRSTATVQEAMMQVERAFQQTPNLVNILKAGQSTMDAVCQLLQLLSPWMPCMAKQLDSTIAVGFGVEGGFLGLTADTSLNLVWGENGAFACTTGLGFGAHPLAVAEVGVSIGVSISQRTIMGGWDAVGAPLETPEMCISVGYDLAGFGVAGAVSIDASKYPNDEAIVQLVEETFTISQKLDPNAILTAALTLGQYSGTTSVGVDVGYSADLIDLGLDAVGGAFIPSVDMKYCSENIISCNGPDGACPEQPPKPQCEKEYGDYCVVNFRNRGNGKMLDVAKDIVSYVSSNGSTVVARPFSRSATSHQQWTYNTYTNMIHLFGAHGFFLRSMVLDVHNGVCQAGQKVQIWEYFPSGSQYTENQSWEYVDGKISLRKCGRNLVLAEAANGDIILAGDQPGSAFMIWDMVKSTGTFSNRAYAAAGYPRYFALSNGYAEGSKLVISPTKSTYFELNGVFISGEGTIQTFDHRLCLGLSQGSSCEIGDTVIFETCSDTRAQKWSYQTDGRITNNACFLVYNLAAGADGSIILANNENTDFMKWDYTG